MVKGKEETTGKERKEKGSDGGKEGLRDGKERNNNVCVVREEKRNLAY